jgi:hypothetical protein
MFRATMCPSSEEITVSMLHLVFVTLKQDINLILQGSVYKMEGIIYMNKRILLTKEFYEDFINFI